MNRKPGPFPFVHSQIALLIFSMMVVSRPIHAEPNEAPAVLQFARKYQQKRIDVPQYKPVKKAPQSEHLRLPAHKKTVSAPAPTSSLVAESDRRQLQQLEGNIAQKDQAIAAQSAAIQKLEKQLSAFQRAAQNAPPVPSTASPHDVQMVQKMAESLYRTLTLNPAPDTMAAKLRQANQQASRAQQSEAAMLEKQKNLKSQLSELQNQLTALKNNRNQITSDREASLNAQLAKLNTLNHQLESDLAAGRQKMSQTAQQIQRLESSMQKLESEKKRYADDNKQLMLQISGHSSTSETLELAKKQHNKLQDELATRQQQLTQLEKEKQQLKQMLAAGPTPAQFADSQKQIKSLQIQLDANVQLLQNQERSASEQAKSSSDALIAERKSAVDKIKSLQEKLDASQTQQAAMQSDQQQLQQKLQKNLLSKAENSAALATQLKALQDNLTNAQHQQSAIKAENDKLQQQLEHAPTAAQLADSQQKVKTLQTQLDANALLLQKKEINASEQVKASNAALLAEKQTANDKLVAVQAKLDALQKQQTVLLSEKQQFQKKLDAAPDAALLAESQLKIKALQGQLDTALLLQKKDAATSKDIKADDSAVIAENKAAAEKIKDLQQKLDAVQAQLTEATKLSAVPLAKGLPVMTPETLKKKSTREAYAIGISLGAEILQLQAENRNWASTDSDKPSVLAGIIDSFQGKEKLPPDELHKSLMNISERVKSGREKYIGDLDKSTKKYIANFTKQKNAKKSDSGFWYRVGYAGDTPIPEGAVIDVVVKESLTNGIIIEDMDAKGVVLTQPISAFPPVFREALSKLKNHGSMTIVVPPALAYGEKGYPPKVPPNATMVYDLRVSDIYPEQVKK